MGILFSMNALAQRFAVASGTWEGAIWATTVGGVAGSAATPTSADAVTINAAIAVNINSAAQCASLTLTTGTAGTTVTINLTNSLTVTGNISIGSPSGNGANTVAVGAGTLTAGSLTMVTAGNNNKDCILSISTGTASINGNVIMQSAFASHHIDITSTGTINIGGNIDNGAGAVGGGFTAPPVGSTINLNGTSAQTVFLYGGASTLGIVKINNTAGVTSGSIMTLTTLTIGDVTSNSIFSDGGFQLTSTGTLNLTSGTFKLGAAAATTFPAFVTINISAGTTIQYASGLAQTVSSTPTYQNLTLSGAGVKTTTGITVNGIFSIAETATASAAPTYGAAATLQYNTATGRTAGAEWVTPFTGTGGVIIANTGTITANAAKVFNTNIPLTINSGATLSTGNFQFTFAGNFVNNIGTFTAGSSPIVIANTMVTQSIAGFTTTGLVSMTKTAGTATLQGVVSGGGLTINGSGGTLDIGTALSHTFTGTVTLTIGTLQNLSTSSLTVGGDWTKATAATFTPGAGTVTFNGTGAQAINGSAVSQTFNNLTVNKTVATLLSVGGNTTALTVSGNFTQTQGNFTPPATLDVTGTVTLTAGTFTAGTNVNVGGDWTNNGATFTPGSSTVTFTGTNKNIGGSTATTFASLTLSNIITSSQSFSASGTMTVNGTFTPAPANIISGAGTLTGSGTVVVSRTSATADFSSQYTTTGKTLTNLTVEYAGASAQTVSAVTYGSLKINNSNGVTSGGAVTVNGNLNIAAGSWSDNGSQITGNAGGTLSLAAGTSLTLGTITTATTFPTNFITANITLTATSTVVYNSNVAQAISVVPTYGHLTLTSTSSVTKTISGILTANGNVTVNTNNILNITGAGDVTVGGNFNLTGTLTNAGTLTVGS